MASSTHTSEDFIQGRILKSSEPDFFEGLKAVVDYRGDVTLSLVDGNTVEGYIYNQSLSGLEIFPKNSPRAISINFKEIDSIQFSGEDTANGKTFDDWTKKKEAEKVAIKAQPIEMA
ncbi:MAG: uncharacterized protein JWQ35_2183 [Bacteriovoracaceae bacterium]|nr:uncharacterized protein [Bacteriovoracaceae bacterium]